MNQLDISAISSGLVPVVIGVTGHRDIPESDVDKLAETTRAALDEIVKSSPHSPHVLLSCRGDDRLVHVASQQILFALGVEQKLLPASIINRFAKERVADIEAQQGYKVSRKALKDIKEAVTEELLPRAFAIQRTTYAWLDTVNGRLIIDAASVAKAEELLEQLSKTLDGLPVKPLQTKLSPVAAMTDWLAGGNVPTGFTIDRELELRATGESKATVRYANHALEGKEILAHIAAGTRKH